MITVPLTHGIAGHMTATVRMPTAGDIYAALLDAEKAMMVPVGVDGAGAPVVEPALIVSPTLADYHGLRRAVSIGPWSAPLESEIFDKLHSDDLRALQEARGRLEQAAFEVARRGRFDQAGAGD